MLLLLAASGGTDLWLAAINAIQTVLLAWLAYRAEGAKRRGRK